MGDVALRVGEEVEDGMLKVGWEEVPVEARLVVGMEGEAQWRRTLHRSRPIESDQDVCYGGECAEHVGEERASGR